MIYVFTVKLKCLLNFIDPWRATNVYQLLALILLMKKKLFNIMIMTAIKTFMIRFRKLKKYIQINCLIHLAYSYSYQFYHFTKYLILFLFLFHY